LGGKGESLCLSRLKKITLTIHPTTERKGWKIANVDLSKRGHGALIFLLRGQRKRKKRSGKRGGGNPKKTSNNKHSAP